MEFMGQKLQIVIIKFQIPLKLIHGYVMWWRALEFVIVEEEETIQLSQIM